MNLGDPTGMTSGGMQPQGIDPMQAMGAPEGASVAMDQAMPEPDMQPQGPSISELLEQTNIAESLHKSKKGKKTLEEIGKAVKDGFDADKGSRADWEERLEDWTKLAMQVAEEKNFPWPKASNIKYPILATAAMQFQARAYPTLVPSNGNIVKVRVLGYDQDGSKTERAWRVGTYMNWQLMCQMEDWEEEMDRLLMILPIVGTAFKKTYYDPNLKRNVSRLVYPRDLVVNYWAKNLDKAERVTEVFQLSPREVKERQNMELYLDVDLPAPPHPTTETVHDRTKLEGMEMESVLDETVPRIILEQHTYWDLDDDGYAEPYIITVDHSTGKVLRIVARFDETSVEIAPDGKIRRISPVSYYTKYSFIPNPDGGFYDIGFGLLLGPLNKAVDTLINQLVDAGTLNNLQSGFIGKGIKIKMGDEKFRPGEWKPVNSTADDLKKQIFPLPTKEPSSVLFQLLGMLVQSSRELASVAEIMTGKMPGQNTPATTTQTAVEQGMKVFTAIYKRVFRALTNEFKKLYRLNGIYFDPDEMAQILDKPPTPQDFNSDDYDVIPAADPQAITGQEKMQKANFMLQLLPIGTLDPMKVTSYVLEANEVPNWQSFLRQPDPNQKSPEEKKAEAEIQTKQMEAHIKAQMEQIKMKFEQEKHQMKMQHEKAMGDMKMQLQMKEMQMKEQMSRMKIMDAINDSRAAMIRGQGEAQAAELNQGMKMSHAQEKHEMSMQQAKDKAKMQPKKPTKRGGK